jgi:hypothetical protein
MRKRMLFALPFLAVAGCAAGPSLQTRMTAYIGASAQTLVSQLGVPDKQITVSGVQYLAYDQRHLETSPGFFTYAGYGPFSGLNGPPIFDGGFGDDIYGAGIPPRVNEVSCETTFMLKDDHVFNVKLKGDDCG